MRLGLKMWLYLRILPIFSWLLVLVSKFSLFYILHSLYKHFSWATWTLFLLFTCTCRLDGICCESIHLDSIHTRIPYLKSQICHDCKMRSKSLLLVLISCGDFKISLIFLLFTCTFDMESHDLIFSYKIVKTQNEKLLTLTHNFITNWGTRMYYTSK